LDIRQINYFLRVVEESSVTRAAEKLNIAQPTLSKSIRYLEHQLGVALFERLPRGVKLTVYGEKLLDHARHVEVQMGEAIRDIQGLKSGHVGNVRIGAGPSWLRRLLPEAIAEVLDERPDITISVTGGFDESLRSELLDGDLDFVIAELPLKGIEQDFHLEPLTEDRLCICARRGHGLEGRKNIPIAVLQGLQWVLPSGKTLARRKLDALMLSQGMQLPTRVTEADSMSFILALIRESDAITYTITSALTSQDGQDIIILDAPGLEANRSAGLIFRNTKLLSPAAEFVVGKVRKIAHRNPTN
jgi:LysR family transcriptional regulator of gallate degradation